MDSFDVPGCTSWCSKEVYVVDGRAIRCTATSVPRSTGGKLPQGPPGPAAGLRPGPDQDPMKRTNPRRPHGGPQVRADLLGRGALTPSPTGSWRLRKTTRLTSTCSCAAATLTCATHLRRHDQDHRLTQQHLQAPSAQAEKFGPFYTEGYGTIASTTC